MVDNIINSKTRKIAKYSFYTLLSFVLWVPFWVLYFSYEPNFESTKNFADSMAIVFGAISTTPSMIIWLTYSIDKG